MNQYLLEFIALASIHFLAVISPGPDFTITISQSVNYGRKLGAITAIGIGAGMSVHVAYTLLGFGAITHAVPALLDIIKALGAAYLIYLSYTLITAPNQSQTTQQASTASQTSAEAFKVGFFTNATNPKATLFFLVIFTTIVSSQTPITIQIFYGVWMSVVNALWFTLVAIIFSTPKVQAAFLNLGVWFNRAMAALLFAFALRILISFF